MTKILKETSCNNEENTHGHRDHNHEIGNEEDGCFVVPKGNTFGHSFREYDKESQRRAVVQDFYRMNHIHQTYEFAKKKKEEYGKLEKAVMSIWECCELLNEYVDESDPDLDEPQIEHLLQTAEAIRRDYPNEDWLHLIALIHDLGKVLLHPAFGEEPQWSVVGDTFPLGCAFSKSIVHHQFFKENPDFHNPNFNSKLGIYSANCGLDNVNMSWGHDEYMYLEVDRYKWYQSQPWFHGGLRDCVVKRRRHTIYLTLPARVELGQCNGNVVHFKRVDCDTPILQQVAKGNGTTLPPAGLFIIRFHSFYALHQDGDYTYLMSDEDKDMLKWLHVFNKYDLYSKSKVRINQEEVKPYYLSLIEKYFPAKLKW